MLGEDGVASLRRSLLLALGIPCVLAPLLWWGVSAGSMKGEELALVALAIVCAAAALHDALLTLCLRAATWGQGAAAQGIAAAAVAAAQAAHAAEAEDRAAEEEEDDDDWSPRDAHERVARETLERRFSSRFVRREEDRQLEERLKSGGLRSPPRFRATLTGEPHEERLVA